MNRRRDEHAGSKTIITLLSALCVLLIAVSLINPQITGPFHTLTGIVVNPMQKGIAAFGQWFVSLSENMTDASSLREENEALQKQVEQLTSQNSQLLLDREELKRLRKLVDLSEQYSDYDTIGARVISKETGNWYSTFTIDKGSNAGIERGCNVLAQAGLAGIVTETGPNWATVRSIIDDNSSVSAMITATSDTCIIAGNLELIDQGSLSLVKLRDEDNKVHVGDTVVTSNISEKYLPGILIGYISVLNNDANNLTKSGEITPVVDFKHLQEVLVIKQLKQYVAGTDGQDEAAEIVNDVAAPEADNAADNAAENPGDEAGQENSAE